MCFITSKPKVMYGATFSIFDWNGRKFSANKTQISDSNEILIFFLLIQKIALSLQQYVLLFIYKSTQGTLYVQKYLPSIML